MPDFNFSTKILCAFMLVKFKNLCIFHSVDFPILFPPLIYKYST